MFIIGLIWMKFITSTGLYTLWLDFKLDSLIYREIDLSKEKGNRRKERQGEKRESREGKIKAGEG
jgi:hypothetical protein